MREGSKVRGGGERGEGGEAASNATIVISRILGRGGWCFRGGATNKRYQKKVSLTFGCVLLGNATFGSI